MKNNKTLLIILGVVLVLLIGGGVFLLLSGKDEKESTSGNDKQQEVIAPAKNTEELVGEMALIEVSIVSEDEIVFSGEIDLKENEKVAVWIYSEPKFLGYFDVLIENGVKKIKGLKEALESITIEKGEHNIAFTTESGNPLGYINVVIEDSGSLAENVLNDDDNVNEEVEDNNDTDTENIEEQEKEEIEEEKTTTKKITNTEVIKYTSTKQNEVNMKKGTTSVIQAGVNGSKEITYEVTYDANGKEISRKKVSEKITKNPVNEIVKVGVSDFNIKTDTTRGHMAGPACPKDKTYTYDGVLHCNDETYSDLPQFNATIMNGKIIVTSINGELTTAVIATPINNSVYTGTYNGQTYYFDNRMGDGEPGTLTMDFCNKYGLKCGSW